MCVPEDVEGLDGVLVKLQVVPQDLDQHVLTVLGHPASGDLGAGHQGLEPCGQEDTCVCRHSTSCTVHQKHY